MPGQDQWIKSRHLPTQPPHVLRPPGRPKKLRRRDPDESRNPYKVSRMNRQIKCRKCNKLGHNSRSCNASITGETAWQRRQRLKQQKTVRFQLYMHLNIYFYIFQRFYMHLNIFFFFFFLCFLHLALVVGTMRKFFITATNITTPIITASNKIAKK